MRWLQGTITGRRSTEIHMVWEQYEIRDAVREGQWQRERKGQSAPSTAREISSFVAVLIGLFGSFFFLFKVGPAGWNALVQLLGINGFRVTLASFATLLGGLLFWLKKKRQFLYAYTELAFGLAMIWHYAIRIESDLKSLPLIGGGSYLIVRALSNYADAKEAKRKRMAIPSEKTEPQLHTGQDDSPSTPQNSPELARAGSSGGTAATAAGP